MPSKKTVGFLKFDTTEAIVEHDQKQMRVCNLQELLRLAGSPKGHLGSRPGNFHLLLVVRFKDKKEATLRMQDVGIWRHHQDEAGQTAWDRMRKAAKIGVGGKKGKRVYKATPIALVSATVERIEDGGADVSEADCI